MKCENVNEKCLTILYLFKAKLINCNNNENYFCSHVAFLPNKTVFREKTVLLGKKCNMTTEIIFIIVAVTII